MKMHRQFALVLMVVLLASPAVAEDLYKGGNWPSLASDRKADAVGDIITVLVAENNTASNSVGRVRKSKVRSAARSPPVHPLANRQD